MRENKRRLFRATSVKLSTRAVEVAQKVFDEESVKLRSVANGSVTITYQYLSQTFVDAAYANGNAIDLKPEDGPLIGIDLTLTTISDRHLLILACAKRFGISWHKNEKKNSPTHDFRPNLTKSAYKSEHAIETFSPLKFS